MMLRVTRGIFAVWKPLDWLSNAATMKVRATLLGGRSKIPLDAIPEGKRTDFTISKQKCWVKVGHGGTLDKFSEGVLVIGVGRDCKRLTDFLLGTDKEYCLTCELGRMTDTLDPEGVVVREEPWQHIKLNDLEHVLNDFRGTISQVPPAFSAKKIEGKRYSDLAFKSRVTGASDSALTPKAKEVTIKSIELLDFNPPYFSLSVCCSSGTYMRSLARDIGMKLGSVCYVTTLERTRQGEFSRANALLEQDWTVERIYQAIQHSKRNSSNMKHHNEAYE